MRTAVRTIFAFLLLTASACADQRYAITMSDGSVQIMETVGDATPQECIAKWREESKSAVVSITPIDSADVPTDRTFRNAWKFFKTSKKFSTDMPKAREIWKTKLLNARALAAKQADKDVSDAEAVGDDKKKAAAATKRQSLNGVVDLKAIDSASTPDELKATLPPALAPYLDQ